MAEPSTHRRELTDHAERVKPSAYWELLMNLTRRELKGHRAIRLAKFILL